ncbi:MAG: cupin domain-containing protein [Sphaerochaetaceae bacterium]|jgi:quercetin dioxygenase-like cupin family protein
MKNLKIGEVMGFADQVSYQPGQVVSKTLEQNEAVSLTLFAFDKGEEIGTHESRGDALVIVLDGEGEVVIDGKKHRLASGQSIVMPAGHPHSVYAKEQFKMFLVVTFPLEKKQE